MFKPHIGICVCHGKERLIVVKKGFCKIGNDDKRRGSKTGETTNETRYKKNTIKVKRQKPIQYRKKRTGEGEVFQKILEERGPTSQISGLYLGEGYCKIGNDEHKERTGRTKKVSGKPGILPSKVLRSSIPRKTMWVKRKTPLVDKTGNKPTANVCKNSKKTGTQEKKKRKPLQHRRKPTGEAALFAEILTERLQVSPEGLTCRCCPRWIGTTPGPSNFSHVLPKGAYPELRLDKRNIWIVCTVCHEEWDFGDRSQEKFAGKREVADALRQESNLSSS